MISFLQVNNLSKRFGEQLLFENLSFGIGKNQKVALIAKNGMGKSTMLKIIAGKEIADAGTIIFRNDITVGYLEQDPQLEPENNVFEEVFNSDSPLLKAIRNYEEAVTNNDSEAIEELIPQMDALAAWDYETQVKQILSELKINKYNQRIKELSGGQKKRVAIAGVLAMNPKILILDEPTAGLDPKGRDEILDQIAELHKVRGITIILVSHSMEDVAKYVERLIVVNHGKIAFDDTPKKVFAHYKELEEMGLAAPQITYIMHALKEKGLPVDPSDTTVEEARADILHALKEMNSPLLKGGALND